MRSYGPPHLPMRMTRLLLVRHGETDDNKNLVFQGQLGCGLNAAGRDQAARLASRLVRTTAPPSALYTSDLRRARETAAILGDALGLEPLLDPDLREVDLGAWQGLSHAEVEVRFADEWAAWRAGRDIRRGGGETYAELGERMAGALGRIARAHPGGAAIVVSHGAALKTFAGRALGMAVEGFQTLGVQVNTGIAVIEREGEGSWRLLTWNDAAHLHGSMTEGAGD